MSAIELLECQVSLFVVSAVLYLLFQEYKRQTSFLAQVGRAWKRYVDYCEKNKEYTLSVYRFLFDAMSRDVDRLNASYSERTRNEQTDRMISFMEKLVEQLEKARKSAN
ncbi:MAG: hypothetical protein EAZ74_01580 [Alphaproteobacteria bacterium]|nr:MAG: hypothetical protein EAY76_06720 [Alphaproteobacteria bacterium]TAF15485.1 MAG: hypothetical protein EAZ74_01580 [Alphaproteobacteria bacterium]